MTIPLPLTLRQQIYELARSQFPNEACGVILNKNSCVALDNLSSTPEHNFVLPDSVYQMQGVTHIWHSHNNGNPNFSLHDLRVADEIGQWDWYLISITDPSMALDDAAEDYLDVRGRGDAPYIGRQWRYGWHDCYSLCHNFYRRELGIKLDDFQRDEDEEWMGAGFTKFADNMEKQGFIKIDGQLLKKGDFLLMQLGGAPQPNHIAVMTDERVFMHHLAGHLSCWDIFGGYWQKHTVSYWRHNKLIETGNVNNS